MRKRLFMSIPIICMLLCSCTGLVSCADNTNAVRDKEMQEWLENANLTAEETPQQLYKEALRESPLVVYAGTSRILETKKAFESEYPGLTVEVYDLRSWELIDKLRENYTTRDYQCDVAICTDNEAILSTQYIPQGILHKYVPYDMRDTLVSEQKGSNLLEILGEGAILLYNTEVYSESPVTNWWQLTEPQWKDKIYMLNPLRSHPEFSLICTMIAHSEEMEQAYFELYGKKLNVPEGSNAGKEYWRMVLENGIRFTTTADEATEFVGLPGQTDPPVTITISSKLRRVDIGYTIAPAYGLAPADGVFTPAAISIVGGAKNVNAAKLFIRFTLGEADGQGDGYKPFLKNGAWSMRTNAVSKTPIPLSDVNFWALDTDYISKNGQEVKLYIQSLLEEQEATK